MENNFQLSVNQRFISSIDFIINQGLEVNQKNLSEKLGLKKSKISEIKSGRNNVTLELLYSYCQTYNLNMMFFISGNGSIFTNENTTENEMLDITYEYEDNQVETLVNSHGNKYLLLPNDLIKIEVLQVPFPAYASYIESYTDEIKLQEEFEKVTFTVDHIGKGNYISFKTVGESMNGGGIDDTPNGAEVLAREVGRHLWKDLHSTKHGCILVTKTGIFHKDIANYNTENGKLLLTSRNKLNDPFDYSINDVIQIFNVIKRSF